MPPGAKNIRGASLVIRLLGAWHWPPNPPLLVRIDRETYFSSRASSRAETWLSRGEEVVQHGWLSLSWATRSSRHSQHPCPTQLSTPRYHHGAHARSGAMAIGAVGFAYVKATGVRYNSAQGCLFGRLPRYLAAAAVLIANRTRAGPSQLEAAATRKFRGETMSRGGEIAKKQLSSADSSRLQYEGIIDLQLKPPVCTLREGRNWQLEHHTWPLGYCYIPSGNG